jgi:predicted metalloprotease with PDZ domain
MLGHQSSPKVYANLGPIIYLIYSLSLLIPQCGTQHSHMHSQQIYPHVRPNSQVSLQIDLIPPQVSLHTRVAPNAGHKVQFFPYSQQSLPNA